jgi:hypothetical protein
MAFSSSPRNAQECTLKKKPRKNDRQVGAWVWDLASPRGYKGGAADPCPFWARGREVPRGDTRGDAPQCFRGRLPPPPIWPETRFEESCLSKLELESIWPTAEGGVPVGSQSTLCVLMALGTFWQRGQRSISSWLQGIILEHGRVRRQRRSHMNHARPG